MKHETEQGQFMSTIRISEAQREQYREEGYFILPGVIPEADLRMLRAECDRFIERINAEMDAAGVTVQGLNHRDSRYFIAKRHRESDYLPRFIFSDLIAQICRATLGDEAYLFWEQYVVKCAEVGMKFSWHQDSGYVGHDHRPYVTCWCALDPVSEENGTAYILPFSRAGTRQREEHVRQEGSNDLVGYHGDDRGIPVVGPAGTIAVFSSVTFHRSGPNRTGQIRRVYLPQYSAEPILKRDGSGLWGFAEPFLKEGEVVACVR
jgi:ectoine hydroxylase-related dioxygenase (phytanoyl-CoA dioxygenase family)